MATSHTNKKTGIIENPKVCDIVERVNTKVIELFQPTDELSSSNTLTTNDINRLVVHYRTETDAQFEKLNAFMRTRFQEFSGDGSGSGGSGV
ncbi:unnamed protein product [Cochlearia groenlandica]